MGTVDDEFLQFPSHAHATFTVYVLTLSPFLFSMAVTGSLTSSFLPKFVILSIFFF